MLAFPQAFQPVWEDWVNNQRSVFETKRRSLEYLVGRMDRCSSRSHSEQLFAVMSVRGFPNPSNSCFVNSSVQLLLRIPHLLSLSSVAAPHHIFLQTLQEVQLLPPNQPILSTESNAWRCVQRFCHCADLSALEQQDVYQFLQFFLAGVEGEMREIAGTPRLTDFIGFKVSSAVCSDQLILSVDPQRTLQDALQSSADSIIHGKLYLLIAIKRVVVTAFSHSKITQFLSFPLVLTLPSQHSITHEYSLIGVIVHKGEDCAEGHYTAFLRNQGDWFHANDGSVRKVTEKWVKRQQAYVLLYVSSAVLRPVN